MTPKPKQRIKAAKTLRRFQGQQANRVQEIGGLRRQLEKRNRQLQMLEVKMAALEHRAFGPDQPADPLVTIHNQALRPARVIVNAESGSFARVVESPEKLAALLRAHGILATIYVKTTTKAVRAWVREAVKANEALVIAAGGDGTIGDVAYELVGSRTVLGILPTGTMNNLARELGIPLDVDQACALIGAGITRQIDVGRVHSDRRSQGHYFLETAGLGLAIALPAGQNVKKGRWGKLPAAFREMFVRGPEPIEIELETGEKIETQVQLVTVSNAPLYGLNNLIAPEAKMDDGLLDLAVYDGLSDLELAAYFLKTAGGQRVSDPNVHFYRTRRVRIRSRAPLPETADKDELPSQKSLEFELIPRAISVIVGNGSGLVWPVEATTSVPPLTGEQVQPKHVVAAEVVEHTNGTEHVMSEQPDPPPVPDMAGAR